MTESSILAVRIHAGFNAGAFLAGLLALNDLPGGMAGAYLRTLFPNIDCGLEFAPRYVNSIRGMSARILAPIRGMSARILAPKEHAHRHPADIRAIYAESRLSDAARTLSDRVWRVLAQAEAKVHGMSMDEVHFHEVGRMANILAIGLSAELFLKMNVSRIAASPIPMNEGEVECAHGLLPYPAPAMFTMLDGVAVRGSSGKGELVTPTGLAILKGFGAEFGPWPEMTIEKAAQIFVWGTEFEGVPNGSRFFLGSPAPAAAE